MAACAPAVAVGRGVVGGYWLTLAFSSRSSQRGGRGRPPAPRAARGARRALLSPPRPPRVSALFCGGGRLPCPLPRYPLRARSRGRLTRPVSAGAASQSRRLTAPPRRSRGRLTRLVSAGAASQSRRLTAPPRRSRGRLTRLVSTGRRRSRAASPLRLGAPAVAVGRGVVGGHVGVCLGNC